MSTFLRSMLRVVDDEVGVFCGPCGDIGDGGDAVSDGDVWIA